jgi:hypothetical protein
VLPIQSDDGDICFEVVTAWTRTLVPSLGREVARWSGQVSGTPDYCGFIAPRSPVTLKT